MRRRLLKYATAVIYITAVLLLSGGMVKKYTIEFFIFLSKRFRRVRKIICSQELNFLGKFIFVFLMFFGKRGLAFLLIFSLVLSNAFFFGQNAQAATYTFTQSSWSAGATSNTAVHPTNQSSWTQYSSATNVTAGVTAALSTAASSTTQTSDTDFNTGTQSSTVVSGTGASADVQLSSQDNSGSGADGAVTISTTKNINTDTLASGRSCADGGDGVAYNVTVLTSSTTATLSTTPSTGCISANDIVLLINLQGDGTNLTNVGNYEVLTVQSVSTNVITFTGNKTKYYGNGASDDTNIGTATSNQRVILQRVPQYTDVTIASGGTLTATAWNGQKGGVLALYASGTVDVQSGGSLTMSEKGYRQGSGGAQGESYNKVGVLNNLYNLGGGGYNNAGGDFCSNDSAGGGGYGGGGGFGDDCLNGTADGGAPYGGTDLSKMYVGSGGGGNSSANSGGGIVYVNALAITVGGSIFSKGRNAAPIDAGGAGGSVFLQAPTLTLGTTLANATGGSSAVNGDGGLGGGGNGRIHLISSSITGTTNPTYTASSSPASTYYSSGTFTSAVIDTGIKQEFTTLSYTKSTPTNTTLTIDARAGNTATPDGTWTSWQTGVASDGDISGLGSNRYVQYRVNLATTDTAATPTLSDITINYNAYNTSGSIVSSKYDSGSASNLISKLTWSGSGTSTPVTMRLQVRTASSAVGLDSAQWCGYSDSGTCTGSNYFTDSNNSVSIAAGNPLNTGGDDQWFQYKVAYVSDGSATPTLSGVTVQYVVNAPPEFNPNYPATGNGGVGATQNADGTVTINYAIRDPDTTTGSLTPGFVTPSFQYSLDGGSTWTNISTATLGGSDVTNKAVTEVAYTTYSATWNAVSQISGQYSTTAEIRVATNDNEAASNTASSTSATFTLDTKTPVLGASPVIVDASQSPALVTLSATDDSALQMKVGKVSNLSDATYEAYSSTKTLTISSGDTVYAQFKDAKSNTTSIVSITPPTSPGNLFYQDTSNPSTSDWREFIAWGVVSAPSAGFRRYNVYRSVDGSGYTLLTTVTNRLVNYSVDTGLSNASTYSYKVSSEDNNGDISFFSQATPTDTPNGVGGSDIAPPTLTVVTQADVTTTGATITWTSNKLSNSTVYYLATTTYPGTDKTLYGSSTGVPSMVTSHSVALSGLTPGTQYHFLVESQDVSNNIGQSASALYTFTTAPGPVISNVTQTSVFDTQATISWNTNVLADSSILYSVNADMSDPVLVSSALPLVTSHSVTVTGLTHGVRYYYYVKSVDVQSNIAFDKNVVSGVVNYYTFNTTIDTVPPVISDTGTSLIGETGATITWTTDEPATSQLEYGTTTSMGTLTSENVVYTNEHAFVVTGLANTTEYYYRVLSKDMSGNQSSDNNSGANYNFTTLTPTVITVTQVVGGGGGGTIDNRDLTIPVISNIKIDSITDTSAIVNFTTSKITNGTVSYGVTASYTNTSGNTTLYSTTHMVKLSGLSPATRYHFKAAVADIYNNQANSSDATFMTAAAGKTLPASVITTATSIPLTSPILSSEDKTLLVKVQSASSALVQNILTALSSNQNLAAVSERVLASSFSDIASRIVSSPVISGTDVTVQVSSHSATIEWTTDKQANSLVAYAKADDYNKGADPYTITAGFPDDKTTTHRVVLDNLTPTTTYHYQVRSHGAFDLTSKSTDKTFTTTSLLPEVAEARFNDINDSGAVFTWKTDLPTKSTLSVVNTKTGEVKKMDDPSYTLDHTSTIQGLDPATDYTLKIIATDDSGNVSPPSIIPFVTVLSTKAPTISNIKISTSLISDRVETAQTIISWKTDKPSTSKVYFALGGGTKLDQSTPADTTLVRDHIVITTAFSPGQIYKIKVASNDSAGNTTESLPYTVLMPKAKGSVVDIIFKNANDIFGFLGGKK